MATIDGGAYRVAITRALFSTRTDSTSWVTERSLGFAANQTVHARRSFWLDRCVCLRSMINALSIDRTNNVHFAHSGSGAKTPARRPRSWLQPEVEQR